MNWADLVILGIIALSGLISLWRGFVKEALSLAAWVAALWVALAFADPMAGMLSRWIEVPSLRVAVAFGILFIAVLLLGALVNYLAGQLVKKTGLSGTDRMLGIVFGVVRGAMVVAILVLLAGMTALPQDPWWHESRLMEHFVKLALWLRDFLPAGIADDIRYY